MGDSYFPVFDRNYPGHRVKCTWCGQTEDRIHCMADVVNWFNKHNCKQPPALAIYREIVAVRLHMLLNKKVNEVLDNLLLQRYQHQELAVQPKLITPRKKGGES